MPQETMLYDTKIRIIYEYEAAVSAGRHIVRLMPLSRGGQRLVAGAVSIAPEAAERIDGHDFFGNATIQAVLRRVHDELEVTMQARVAVDRPPCGDDVSPDAAGLASDLAAFASLAPDSPHHFLAPSPRVPDLPEIGRWARAEVGGVSSVRGFVEAVGRTINETFEYDPEATEVDTTPREAFALKRGVCQDFTHVMIAALRSVGIPAAYTSGVLRTLPPPGRPRLEGADAMHAWVRAWCGAATGWVEYDPTNAIFVRDDHIVVAYGRDYSDVTPLAGIVKTYGGHKTDQFVDVKPVG